jgi:hypothetical protein
MFGALDVTKLGTEIIGKFLSVFPFIPINQG